MDLSTTIMIIGVILVNATTVFSAWLRVKTDLAALRVEMKAFDARLNAQSDQHGQVVAEVKLQLQNIDNTNVRQHEAIGLKVDGLKDSITDLKVSLAKRNTYKTPRK